MVTIIKSIINTIGYKLIINPLLNFFSLKEKLQIIKNKKNQLRWIASDVENATPLEHYTSLPKEGPEIELLNVVKTLSGKNDRILDIGANCGRFSNDLFQNGFKNLYAVDISQAAHDNLSLIFPELREKIDYKVSSFEEFFSKIPDNFFDVTFTMGATIDLVHPLYDIVEQIARVTKNYSILQLQKSGPPYIRFWDLEFKIGNFKKNIVKTKNYPNFELRVFKKK